MKSVWMLRTKKADFESIGKKYNIDGVFARVMRNREVITDEQINEYLNGDITSLHNPHLMKDMDKAINIIAGKISEKKKIRIIGDYDIDGVCSIYILLKGLKKVGAEVDYVIPHRVLDGYGINENLITNAHNEGVDTIVTCDNGIAAIEQVEYAKSLGMTIIVTDHHDIRFEENEQGEKKYIIPAADAVVNPKQNDCEYAFKGLCGAVVAWKFVTCLYEYFKLPKEEYLEFLSYAAIATIGDVMVLQGENRIIVKEGLKQINSVSNLGLDMLIQANGLTKGEITCYHIGFVIGPCINASGRLDTANWSLELLCATDRKEAERLAGDLKGFNDERKRLTLEYVEKAVKDIEGGALGNDNVLVEYLPGCHESIAGIIAGKLREQFYKPVLVITDSEEGLKGSGRSIEGYNMFEELLKCDEFLTKYGGHPMAAGLSLKKENLEALRKRLNDNCQLTEKELTPVTWIDLQVPISYITEDFIKQIDILEPFGNGNSKPVFADRMLTVKNAKVIGQNKNVLKCTLISQNGCTMDAIKFESRPIEQMPFNNDDIISIIYYPSINEYNGRKSLQVVINECKITE